MCVYATHQSPDNVEAVYLRETVSEKVREFRVMLRTLINGLQRVISIMSQMRLDMMVSLSFPCFPRSLGFWLFFFVQGLLCLYLHTILNPLPRCICACIVRAGTESNAPWLSAFDCFSRHRSDDSTASFWGREIVSRSISERSSMLQLVYHRQCHQ